MNKIKTIIQKEWSEVFRNRFVLFTVAFLPLIMTAIPLGMLFAMRGESNISEATSEMPEVYSAMCPEGLKGSECFQVYIVSQFMLMFMILPVAIPATIASYSIVGEKVNKSLEPLLATPITTVELLTAKSLAAVVPAIVATWAGFALYALGARLLIASDLVYATLLDVRWLIAILVVGPLLALLAVSFSMMISSRVTDPRAAEQISSLMIIPVLLVFFGQLAGLFFLNRQLILVAAILLVFVDALLLYLAVRVFQREVILTRWK